MAAEIRATIGRDRHVHLVLEHDGNDADHLRRGFDAQWNDDAHHVLHVLLTGESDGYYSDYATAPAERLARCLAEGFVFQGEPSPYRDGEPRGKPSADLPPTAFVLFLQNHDQIGNRAFGDRLTDARRSRGARGRHRAAAARPAASRCCSWARSGRAARPSSSSPTSTAIWPTRCARAGAEFASSQPSPASAARDIPDPNAPRDLRAQPRAAEPATTACYRTLLKLRHDAIVPRLRGATAHRRPKPIGDAAVAARWRMGDGAVLHGRQPRRRGLQPSPPHGAPVREPRRRLDGTRLAGRSTVAFLEPAP